MKELKFTPENLKRHLLAKPYYGWHTRGVSKHIITARDESKGKPGDVFFIKGIGKFCLLSVHKITRNKRYGILSYPWYDDEGFSSESEFFDEMFRLYGKKLDTIYVHRLIKLNEGD